MGALLLVMFSALSKEIGVTAIALCLSYHLLIHRKVYINSTSCAAKTKKNHYYASSIDEYWISVGDV